MPSMNISTYLPHSITDISSTHKHSGAPNATKAVPASVSLSHYQPDRGTSHPSAGESPSNTYTLAAIAEQKTVMPHNSSLNSDQYLSKIHELGKTILNKLDAQVAEDEKTEISAATTRKNDRDSLRKQLNILSTEEKRRDFGPISLARAYADYEKFLETFLANRPEKSTFESLVDRL
jgi:ABC-type hemin transport system ATPase subunit